MTTEQLEYEIKVQDAELKRLRGEVEGLNKQLGDGTAAAGQKGNAELQKMGQTAGRVGFVVTAAFAGIAGGAIKMAGDYESSLNVLQSVSGSTGAEMKRMSELAKQLGADTKLPGTSAKDAADAMVEMSKAGLDVRDTMSGVRSVLVLSAAAQVSNARAAEIATNAMNAFKLSGKDLTLVTDLLANAANASSLEIDDAADSIKMAGAVFSGIQGPAVGAKNALIDLTTATAILGNAGIKGSDAGTSLKQMLLQLTGPSEKSKDAMRALYIAALDAGAGQDKLTDAVRGGAKVRGEAISELEKAAGMTGKLGDIAYDAAGRMRPLKEIVGLVAAGTKNMTQEQRNSYITQIFGADASRAVIALLNEQAKGWDNMRDKVTRSGAAQDLAEARMKGFKGSIDAFKSSLETAAIVFGGVLLPAATAFLKEFLIPATSFLGDHSTATMILVGALGAFGVALLTASAIIKVYTSWQTITRAATLAWTAAQWLLNVALTANPIGLVIVALVALGVGLMIAWKKSETFREIVTDSFEWIKRVAGDVAEWITVKIPAAFNAVIDWVKTNWPIIAVLISGPFAPLVALATNAFGIRDKFTAAMTAMKKWAGDAIDAIVQFFKDLPGRIFEAVKDLGKRIIKEIGKIVLPISLDIDLPGPFGDHPGRGRAGAGGLVAGILDELALGRAMGLSLTSGLRPGDFGSDHAVGKAIDMAGHPALMRRFALAAMGRPGIKDVLYDPLGFSMDNGRVVSWRPGDHYDHVHVSVFHSGGIVGPRIDGGAFGSGWLGPGDVPAVLQQGEGVFTPAQMGALAPMTQVAAAVRTGLDEWQGTSLLVAIRDNTARLVELAGRTVEIGELGARDVTVEAFGRTVAVGMGLIHDDVAELRTRVVDSSPWGHTPRSTPAGLPDSRLRSDSPDGAVQVIVYGDVTGEELVEKAYRGLRDRLGRNGSLRFDSFVAE